MYLLFDIGATNLRLAVSSDGKKLEHCCSIPTPQNFRDGLEILKDMTNKLTHGQKIKAVAGGTHGMLNKNKTSIVSCPHLPGWIGKPLVPALRQMWHCPVSLENDANLAGLGEATYGAGRRYPIVAFLTISTGVGGTRIYNKRFEANAIGFEPGQQIINADRPAFLPNQSGRLEGYISGTALGRKHGRTSNKITNQKVWREFEQYLGYGLVNVVRFWSPHVIVLGGGVMENRHISCQRLNNNLRRMLPKIPILPRVVRGRLGQRAGLYGAVAWLAQR